jgi:hypothetical protein
MASDRSKAKQDVVAGSEESSEPAEFSSALSSAHTFKHELAKKKEEHRHIELMRDKEIAAAADDQHRELGRFGRLLGGSANAPLAIASIVVVAGLGFVAYCLHAGAYSKAPTDWFHEAEWGGALAASSLSFIFGRSGKT